MIEGVRIIPLRRIDDERGAVIPMLRADVEHFSGFGEMYFSIIEPGAIKAWKRHTKMTLNLTVPAGEAVFVLFDDRPGSATRGESQVHSSSAAEPTLLIVPPGLWSGFTNLSDTPAVVANCADILHDPAEAENRNPQDPAIPFHWGSLTAL